MKPRRKYTISQAKNLMRRAAEEILDPGPRSVDAVWEFFDARCAYCGRDLDRGEREGHTDHAEPDGGNHLGNLVLACGACNGDEKREMGWREFLRLKAASDESYRLREARILEWFALHPRLAAQTSPDVVRIRAEIEQLVDAFGAKCNELKDALRRADGA